MIINLLRKVRALTYKFIYGIHDQDFISIIGVTGTDGKTTSVNLLYDCMNVNNDSHGKVGVISTLGMKYMGDKFIETGLHTSTPSSKEIYRNLRILKRAGIKYVILELTSHGLEQYRSYGIKLDIAYITNITPEHLDYHKTFELYRSAKLKIFNMLKQKGLAIVNLNDNNSRYILEHLKNIRRDIEIHTFSVQDNSINKNTMENLKADVTLRIIDDVKENESLINGQKINIKLRNINFDITTHLIGEYNVENIGGVFSALYFKRLNMKALIKGISDFKSPEGRLDIVQTKPFTVIVDFAHTPNAYKNISYAFRGVVARKIVVFGCAGHRDKQKRPVMGKIAGDFADILCITEEDPRMEKLDDIYLDITKDIDKCNKKFIEGTNLFRIDDRRDMIEFVLTKLVQNGDYVFFLGKGHERSLCIGQVEYPWSEVGIVKEFLLKDN